MPEVPARLDSQVDVQIIFGRIRVKKASPTRYDFNIKVTPKAVFLIWQKEQLSIAVKSGKTIVIDAPAKIDGRLLRLCILGPALTTLLQQRGVLVLHGSAVEKSSKVYAFIGESGAGKSTIVSVLQRKGCPLVTDNGMAISFEESKPMVLPGFPQVKLLPKTLKFLNEKAFKYMSIEPGSKKKSVMLQKFSERPRPLKKIFLLKKGLKFSFKRLRANEALKGLMRHCHGAVELMDAKQFSTQFFHCAQLAKKVPVFEVTRTNYIEELPALTARLIGGDFSE